MFKKLKVIIPIMIGLLINSSMGFAQVASQIPYGISTPKIYDYNNSTGRPSSYYIDIPTLTQNEIFSLVKKQYRTIPLTGFYIDGTGVIGNDGTTAPGLAENDGIPSIVWANTEQSSTYRIQYTFKIPDDYSSGAGLAILGSESSETTDSKITVDVWEQNNSTAFSDSAYHCASVSISSNGSTKNNYLNTDIHSGTANNLVAGDWITIGLFPTAGSGNTEIKGVEFYYTPK